MCEGCAVERCGWQTCSSQASDRRPTQALTQRSRGAPALFSTRAPVRLRLLDYLDSGCLRLSGCLSLSMTVYDRLWLSVRVCGRLCVSVAVRACLWLSVAVAVGGCLWLPVAVCGCLWLSVLSVPVCGCPCLSVSVSACGCVCLSVIICHCLSF